MTCKLVIVLELRLLPLAAQHAPDAEPVRLIKIGVRFSKEEMHASVSPV